MRRTAIWAFILAGVFSSGVWVGRGPITLYPDFLRTTPSVEALIQAQTDSQNVQRELRNTAVELLVMQPDCIERGRRSLPYGALNARVEQITLKLQDAQLRIDKGRR